jgi:hypothetical protein
VTAILCVNAGRSTDGWLLLRRSPRRFLNPREPFSHSALSLATDGGSESSSIWVCGVELKGPAASL